MAKTSLPILRKLSLFIRNKSQFRLSLGQPFLFFLDFYGVGDARFYLYLSPLFLFRLLTGQAFDIPRSWQDRLSIDPGLNNPTACHWYAVDGDGVVFVVAEHYESGKSVDYHAARIKEISDLLSWKKDSFNRVEALIDSAANQQTLASSASVSRLFSELGIAVNPKVNKNLFAGIARVKQYLKGENGVPKIRIFRNCVNLIRELKTYRWGEGDTPVKREDHCLDELRYFIMTLPEPTKPLPEKKSDQLLFKEKLMKKRGRA